MSKNIKRKKVLKFSKSEKFINDNYESYRRYYAYEVQQEIDMLKRRGIIKCS